MTFPETIRRQPRPKEAEFLPQTEMLRFSLPYDLSMDLHQLTKEIKEADKNRLMRAFILLGITIDQVQQKNLDQKERLPIVANGQLILREDHLTKYRPEPKDNQSLSLTRAEANLARVTAKAHGEKTAVYVAEAIACGLAIMKAAQNQITYPVAVALTLGDQGFLFRYQDRQQVLTPINSKPV